MAYRQNVINNYNEREKEEFIMKKMLLTLLLAGVTSMSLCFPGHCTHVHDEDCGPDGINCTHECITVLPKGDEHAPY